MSESDGAAQFKHPQHEKPAPWGHKEKGRKETLTGRSPTKVLKRTQSLSWKKTSTKSLKEVLITEGSQTTKQSEATKKNSWVDTDLRKSHKKKCFEEN